MIVRQLIKILVVFVILLAGCQEAAKHSESKGKLTIVENGESKYRIVISAEASKVEKFAAA